MKFLIVLALLAILATLAAAGWFMLNKPADGSSNQRQRMARALALRVALSVLLFVGILLAWALGWIHPSAR